MLEAEYTTRVSPSWNDRDIKELSHPARLCSGKAATVEARRKP